MLQPSAKNDPLLALDMNILTVRQAAAMIQLDRRTLYREIRAGRLRAARTPGGYCIAAEALAAYLNDLEGQPCQFADSQTGVLRSITPTAAQNSRALGEISARGPKRATTKKRSATTPAEYYSAEAAGGPSQKH